MSVLMITQVFPPEFSGAVIQGVRLAQQLKSLNVEVDFVADNGDKTSREEFYEGIRVYRLRTFISKNNSLRRLIYSIRLLIFICKRNKYRILHFHAIYSDYEPLLFFILKTHGRKIILKMTLVGWDDPVSLKKRKWGWLFFGCLKFVDRFVAISYKQIELASKGGIQKEKIIYIPNGIDTNTFKKIDMKERELLKDSLGYSMYKMIFLSIGKVEERKNYIFLLNAWKHIFEQVPSSSLLIIGPANVDTNYYYLKLKREIEILNLKNVFFLGSKSNVDKFFKIADCFLFSSFQEGFGTVQIEAIASSVPLVTRYIDGVSENVFIHPDVGKICFSDSPKEFAELAIEVLNMKRKQNFDVGVQIIRDFFSFKRISNEYLTLYRNLGN